MDIENMTEDAAFEKEEELALESEDFYKHEFRKPFVYEGKSYETLSFDFGGMTGRAGLEIEDELMTIGKTAIVPAFNGEYLIRFAAKACSEPIGEDAFKLMSYGDYNKITRQARNFILRSER